jgi:hypothetical protein
VKRTSDRSPANVVVRSIAFTPTALEVLESFAGNIATRIGRKASVSAVVRALLRHAEDTPDLIDRLAALVEHEQSTEVIWGKPPRAR